MEDDDSAFAKEAMKLIGGSAKTAGNRLNFYRFAYGSGRGGSARDAAMSLLEGGKLRCEWAEAASALPVDFQRLACNMLVLAAEVLPRGGTVTVAPTPGKPGVVVNACGESVNLVPELRAALADNPNIDELTVRGVHAYYTARTAEALGAKLVFAEAKTGTVTFTAT